MANDSQYANAAQAVNSGKATAAQRDLNDRMAKQVGASGNAARAAREGKLK